MASVKSFLNRYISEHSPIRLMYHRFMAILAAFLYRFPADRLKVIAVTGTNGKTSTVNFISEILIIAGKRVGMMSSILFRVGDQLFENAFKQTTLGPFKIQRLLREMVNKHCEYVVIEVTSHAMIQSRLWGVNVDIAVLTNITRDHIEYHGSFENYVKAKRMLFEQLNRSVRKPGVQKTAIINIDQAISREFEKLPYDRVFTYGISGKGSIYATDIELSASGSRFILHFPNRDVSISSHLVSEVNVVNAVAAASAAVALGVEINTIQKALQAVSGVPGRLEPIDEGQDYRIIIDYAHTPDAIEHLCRTFRRITEGKLIVVFGATGGGRDKAKRPVMGKVADQYADEIVLTDDDPYEEDRMPIIDQVASGIKRAEGEHLWKIKHRYEAIYFGLNIAQEQDTVLIMGKGCEPIQIVGTEKIPWDDRKVVREILRRRVEVEL